MKLTMCVNQSVIKHHNVKAFSRVWGAGGGDGETVEVLSTMYF